MCARLYEHKDCGGGMREVFKGQQDLKGFNDRVRPNRMYTQTRVLAHTHTTPHTHTH